MRSFLLSISLLLFVTISCTNETQIAQSTPEEAAKGLFEALKAGEFETAERFGTATTAESIRNFATNLKMINDDEKLALMAPFQMEVSKVSCAEEQGTTRCKLCCSTEGDIIIEMVQQDNKWFAQMELGY